MNQYPSQSIHLPENQLKDFFRSNDAGKHAPPDNPYNIIWFLENICPDLPNKDFYLKSANGAVAISSSLQIGSGKLAELMRNEEHISKRVEDLVVKGADINTVALSIVRAKMVKVLKKALELGLNPNYERQGNYPLRYALKRTGAAMASVLWNHPKTDRLKIDGDGKNAAYLAIEHQRWAFATECWETNPELFLARTANNSTIFHAVSAVGITALEKLSHKNKEFIFMLQEQLLSSDITIHDKNNLGPVPLLNQPFFKELEVRLNYLKLNQALAPKGSSKVGKNKI